MRLHDVTPLLRLERAWLLSNSHFLTHMTLFDLNLIVQSHVEQRLSIGPYLDAAAKRLMQNGGRMPELSAANFLHAIAYLGEYHPICKPLQQLLRDAEQLKLDTTTSVKLLWSLSVFHLLDPTGVEGELVQRLIPDISSAAEEVADNGFLSSRLYQSVQHLPRAWIAPLVDNLTLLPSGHHAQFDKLIGGQHLELADVPGSATSFEEVTGLLDAVGLGDDIGDGDVGSLPVVGGLNIVQGQNLAGGGALEGGILNGVDGANDDGNNGERTVVEHGEEEVHGDVRDELRALFGEAGLGDDFDAFYQSLNVDGGAAADGETSASSASSTSPVTIPDDSESALLQDSPYSNSLLTKQGLDELLDGQLPTDAGKIAQIAEGESSAFDVMKLHWRAKGVRIGRAAEGVSFVLGNLLSSRQLATAPHPHGVVQREHVKTTGG